MTFIDIQNVFSEKPRMLISALLSLLLAVVGGVAAVWTSPMLPILNGPDNNPLGEPLTPNEGSWLASIGIPGSVTGAFLCGLLAEFIGRKHMLALLSIPSMTCYLILAFAHKYWLFLVAKMLEGIVVGGITTILPLYLCEIADPRIRGALCVFIGLAMRIGELATNTLGNLVSFQCFHLIITAIPIIFCTLFLLFGVDSPFFYIQRNPAKAIDLLRQLSGKYDVSSEFEEMKRCDKNDSKGSILEAFNTKASRKAFLLNFGISFFGVAIGCMVIMSYTQFIFEQAGGNWPATTDTIILGTVRLITALFAATIADNFGRKPMISVSFASVGVILTILGGFFLYHGPKSTKAVPAYIGWLPLVCLIGYFIFLDVGIQTVVQALGGELFSGRVKNAGNAFKTIVVSGMGFAYIYLFSFLVDHLGMCWILWIFAVSALCGSAFCYFFLIETKGKTLEEIQDELNGITGKTQSTEKMGDPFPN